MIFLRKTCLLKYLPLFKGTLQREAGSIIQMATGRYPNQVPRFIGAQYFDLSIVYIVIGFMYKKHVFLKTQCSAGINH
jgi:hypothetical protein